MPDFLLELFSEEIPARLQQPAADQLCEKLGAAFAGIGVEFDSITPYVTPRRLVAHVTGLPARQPDQKIERKGPKVGAPEQAIAGFLKSCGLSSLDDCEKRETPKGDVWFAVSEQKGQALPELLPSIIEQVITGFHWPKSMRWGNCELRWIRPLHHILALFDGVPLQGDCQGIEYVNHTFGHRFLAPQSFTVEGFADYQSKLEKAFVILDSNDRKKRIADQIKKKAAAQNLTMPEDQKLLEEVSGLVEWPVVYLGKIPEEFLSVPPEALEAPMRAHQKYFALRDANGDMSSHFALVANMETEDKGAFVTKGNQRVLSARLSDARFFWEQDRKKKLDDWGNDLSKITFHAKLGTMDKKAHRISALAKYIASYAGGDTQKALRAARLAKADLVTGMVYEFPELQGIMGCYYALEGGEDATVAQAIKTHYSPLGPSDDCPDDPVAVSVALADKVDTLVGFFGIDEKPTGSRDPYALRRAALGIIRLLVENKVRVNLLSVFNEAVSHYVAEGIMAQGTRADTLGLMEFIADRLKVNLREKGIRHDMIDAVFATETSYDLVRLLSRVEALQTFLQSQDGTDLLAAYRRAANIVRIEERKDGHDISGSPEPDLMEEKAERVVFEALGNAKDASLPLLEKEDFTGCMEELAKLRTPLDSFFDDVMVNVDEQNIRDNRLKLLSQIQVTLDHIADFSKIEG